MCKSDLVLYVAELVSTINCNKNLNKLNFINCLINLFDFLFVNFLQKQNDKNIMASLEETSPPSSYYEKRQTQSASILGLWNFHLVGVKSDPGEKFFSYFLIRVCCICLCNLLSVKVSFHLLNGFPKTSARYGPV